MTKSYFGDNLYFLRKERGLSQDEFAEKIGVSRQAISKWERNESYPDTENLIAIARFFDVSIDDIINKSLDFQNIVLRSTDERLDNDMDIKSDNDEQNTTNIKNANKKSAMCFWINVPYPIIITVIYLLWGFLDKDGWGIGWTLYVTIPIYYSVIDCIRYKRIELFNYPIFVTFIFLLFGIKYEIWHPLWVIYLTIPIYYPIANVIDRIILKRK